MNLRFAVFALLVFLSTPLFAAPVRIAGVVQDETNHRPAVGATVELMRPVDGKNTPIAKAVSNAQGQFAFPPQNAGAEEILVVRSKWKGYTYVAPAFDGPGQLAEMNIKINPAKVRLNVYDTTTEMVPLKFTAHHLAIESRAGGLKCVERIIVENPTRKTFLGLGERRATLLLNLPPGAKNVKLDPAVTDGKLEKRPDGWAVIKPIAPKVYDQRVLVIINYDMDWPSNLPWARKLDFSRKVQYPTHFFFVARETTDEKLEITAPQLSKDQSAPLPIGGEMQTRLVNAVGNPGHGQGDGIKPALLAGDDLKIQIAAPVNPLFWGFLGFVVLLCLAVPLALWKKGTPAPVGAKIEEPAPVAGVYGGTFAPGVSNTASVATLGDENSRNLIERIANLDEEFQNGKIGEPEYSASRAAWKNELVERLSQLSPQTPQQQSPQE